LLRDCLSEVLEKKKIDRIVLPWDQKFDPNRSNNKKRYGRQELEDGLSKIIDNICGFAFMRVGQFHRRIDDFVEEKKMLKSISQEYQNEGNDWSPQYEYLEVRMELTKIV
jgi:inhibitor of KinA sporulation pathway (predicted exonuclease)